jgi:hypothetical protein
MAADFGPASPWPVMWTCDVSSESPTVTGWAVEQATDVLWAMTGMRFGLSTVKLRPCRRTCAATSYPGYAWDPMPGVGWGSLPWGTGGGWGLIGAACSTCGDSCSCQVLSEIVLPPTVNGVTEVRVDGVILTGGYRVDDNRFLVATGSTTWPYCQNLRLDDTQPGTFSVTAIYGEDVPSGAPAAVGELACEYIKALNGEDCNLPRNVVSLARQGVSMTMPDLTTILSDKYMLGLRLCDLFIHTWNPDHLTARAKTYSVDSTLARRAGT